jgi:hypothetical protein
MHQTFNPTRTARLFSRLFALFAFPFFLAHAQTNSRSATLVSWGEHIIPYVEPGTRFTAIAAGGLHGLALK